MATAASNTAAHTQTEDHPKKTTEPVPATTTIGVSDEKTPATLTDRKDGETKLNTKDPEAVTEDDSHSNNNEDGDSVTDTQRKIRAVRYAGSAIRRRKAEFSCGEVWYSTWIARIGYHKES